MERNRGFNFKLLVPSRVNNGQISALSPPETVENNDFMNTLPQAYIKCCNTGQNMPFTNTSVVAPTKPTSQDFPKMKVVSPMEKEENIGNPGQLYSKLFDEVERIKCWKVKLDSDTKQKERRLQDNTRTIESQRKAIQELQFGNESLSLKLEEQISENEDLRKKNNATRNLCSILKDTFQRSAEKVQLFESEREETHHLFMENSQSIKKVIVAFENLRIRVETDQQEMMKVKDDLLQFVDLKEKYHQECKMKDEQVSLLQTKLNKKENELQRILLDLDETQQHCKQLNEAINQQFELLKSSKTEQESLLQKLQTAEQRCKETENEAAMASTENDQLKKVCEAAEKAQEDLKEKSTLSEIKVHELEEQLSAEIQKNKECTSQIEQLRKDIMHNEVKYEELLANFNEVQSEKMAIQQQFENELSNVKAIEADMKMSKEEAVKLKREIQRLEEENQCLREEVTSIKTRIQEKCQETETLQKKIEESCDNLQKITEKEKQISALETKVQKLSLTAEEAIKDKENTELKCQHKIADMVALMEKHKSQYDRMVEDKDAELHENKKREMEAVAHANSLELDLTKQKTENDQLTKQLKIETKEKENLQKKLTDLKKEMSAEKLIRPSQARNEQSTASVNKQGRCSETPEECSSKTSIFDFPMTRKTPSYSKDDQSAVVKKKAESSSESVRTTLGRTMKIKHIQNEDKKTQGSSTNRVGTSSKIKSYRIRTPPSGKKAAGRTKSFMELDPKSDSSDPNDLLTFVNGINPKFPARLCKSNIFKKIQSPVTLESPQNPKLAAMKRMRDAGWTAVIGCDKKKKKTNEKIFA